MRDQLVYTVNLLWKAASIEQSPGDGEAQNELRSDFFPARAAVRDTPGPGPRRDPGRTPERLAERARAGPPDSAGAGHDLRPDRHAPGEPSLSPGGGMGDARMPPGSSLAAGGQRLRRLLHGADAGHPSRAPAGASASGRSRIPPERDAGSFPLSLEPCPAAGPSPLQAPEKEIAASHRAEARVALTGPYPNADNGCIGSASRGARSPSQSSSPSEARRDLAPQARETVYFRAA